MSVGKAVNTPYGPGEVLDIAPGFVQVFLDSGRSYWFADWEITL